MRGMHVAGSAAALAAAAAPAAALPAAHADVWVDGAARGGHDPAGFVGHDSRYRVVGVVKNTEAHPVAATVAVSAEAAAAGAGGWSASRTFELAGIPAGGEMPFRVVLSAQDGGAAAFAAPPPPPGAPAIVEARVEGFTAGIRAEAPAGAAVVYDRTLRVHGDGAVTGRIANTGDAPIEGVLLAAVAHGRSHEVLDVVALDGPAGPIPPGGHVAFEMRPDPSVGQDVWYYSCFALGDPAVVPLQASRGGETFPMRYTGGVLLSYPRFDESGQTLSLRVIEGWPLQTYANLEFPRYSDGEVFEVLLGGEPADSLQSRDDMGNWHVALSIEDGYSGPLTISGFAPNLTSADRAVEVPRWIRDEAAQWSLGQAGDDRFLDSLLYLAGGGVIDVRPAAAAGGGEERAVPGWVRSGAAWWSQGLVSDGEFVDAMEHLVSIGAVRIG